MKNYTTSAEFLETISLIVFILIAIYIFFRHKKWINYSQGLRPLLMGILLVLTAGITYSTELDNQSMNDFLKILLLRNSANYSIAISRLIRLGYVISIFGVEILLIVLVNKIRYGK